MSAVILRISIFWQGDS